MKQKGPYTTMLVLTTGFLIIYLALNFHWSVYLSLTFGIIGIISEPLSLIIEKLWFKIADLLGSIMPKLILSIIFYLLLTPIAFFYKLFNKNIIRLSNSNESTFNDYQNNFSKENIEKIW